VTAFAAKLRALIVADPHFRNEDENASINKWSLYLVSRLEIVFDDRGKFIYNEFQLEGEISKTKVISYFFHCQKSNKKASLHSKPFGQKSSRSFC
jgi:hypothetical protein